MRSLEHQQTLLKDHLYQEREIENARLLDQIQGVKNQIMKTREEMEAQLKRTESENSQIQLQRNQLG